MRKHGFVLRREDFWLSLLLVGSVKELRLERDVILCPRRRKKEGTTERETDREREKSQQLSG